MSLARRNRTTALVAGTVILAMIGLTAASVPLYRLFCQVTGYGGTTQRAEAAPGAVADGVTVTVAFNADVAPDLPWRFLPAQRRVSVQPGEQNLAFYTAENRAEEPVVGTATFNVTPHKAGIYFHKLACFCFEQQTLEPGQRVEMPVSFFVDPAILEDPATRDVREITLSYTFFVDREATAELRRRRAAGPNS
ncbi:MAG: cytochrome c oxidase assembly protein [Geminicoccaceae bacterium]|nr:cytochrome c oxidase assembly protein [Geminicoccaceae bacterium]MDW8368894.1 cytochrome c oxidase assembly protein [Geminicoccaceae bacterium]